MIDITRQKFDALRTEGERRSDEAKFSADWQAMQMMAAQLSITTAMIGSGLKVEPKICPSDPASIRPALCTPRLEIEACFERGPLQDLAPVRLSAWQYRHGRSAGQAKISLWLQGTGAARWVEAEPTVELDLDLACHQAAATLILQEIASLFEEGMAEPRRAALRLGPAGEGRRR